MNSLHTDRPSYSSSKNGKNSDLDLSNPEIRDLIVKEDLQVKTYRDLIQDRHDKKDQLEENSEKLSESQIRSWMVKHGKKHLINFDDKERFKLKQFFKSLDADGSGSIGIDELVDPLISLGLANTVAEVQKIVDSVDDDHSGQIEFKEFLKIIGGSQENKGGAAIIDFFKDMISGKLAGGKISNKLPFDLIISTVRRKKLMDSMMSNDMRDKIEGEKVMNSYAGLLAARKKAQISESPVSGRAKTSRQGSNSDNMSQSSVSSRSTTKFKRF